MTSTLSPKAATGVLVPAAVRARLTARIRADRPEIDADLADRIVTGTAEFLTVSAADPRARMVPSALIDVGWHAWVLHTVDYAEYCDRIGRFVHRVFCKGVRADRPYAWTHRNEAAVAPFLPASLAPALLWSFVQDGWHMLGFEYVPGRYPSLSPTSGDLDVIGDLVVTMAEALTPCPSAALHSIADRWGAAPGWAAVYAKLPTDLDPWARAHIGVLAMLERGAFLDGDTLVHSDLHPANMLTRDDRVSLLRFDGHLRCGGQAASAASYSTGVR